MGKETLDGKSGEGKGMHKNFATNLELLAVLCWWNTMVFLLVNCGRFWSIATFIRLLIAIGLQIILNNAHITPPNTEKIFLAVNPDLTTVWEASPAINHARFRLTFFCVSPFFSPVTICFKNEFIPFDRWFADENKSRSFFYQFPVVQGNVMSGRELIVHNCRILWISSLLTTTTTEPIKYNSAKKITFFITSAPHQV